jgi:fructokinase
MKPLWGIDLGGTKIEGAIIYQLQPLKVSRRLRLPTEREKGYEHIVDQIVRVVNMMKEETSLVPGYIGIGTPGILDPNTQLIKNSNTLVLNGKPLHQDLEKALGVSIRMANDANCFAIAETLIGAVAQKVPHAQVVFGTIMGTGVGGGLVINGKIRNGIHGITGEWGHNFLDDSGGDCYCGLSGCIEQVISGPALEQFYLSKSGKQRKLPAILALAGDGDSAAIATKERLIHYFGKALSSIINIIDPDAIVLGGGLGNIPELYDEGAKWVEHYTFNTKLETPLLKPLLGDSAGVFGAALL